MAWPLLPPVSHHLKHLPQVSAHTSSPFPCADSVLTTCRFLFCVLTSTEHPITRFLFFSVSKSVLSCPLKHAKPVASSCVSLTAVHVPDAILPNTLPSQVSGPLFFFCSVLTSPASATTLPLPACPLLKKCSTKFDGNKDKPVSLPCPHGTSNALLPGVATQCRSLYTAQF